MPPKPNTITAEVDELVKKFMNWATKEGIEGLGKIFREQLQFSYTVTKPTPSFDANKDKNRYQNVPCLEETRVQLEIENQGEGDYIHANYINFKDHDRIYIATQGPMKSTISDFWRMIWQKKTPIIVNLTKCVENGKAKCEEYWPMKEGTVKKCGSFSITLKRLDCETKDSVNIYLLEILPEGCSDSWIVRLIHHTSWSDGTCLASPGAMLRLIRTIFRVDQLASGPVVIHCSAGIGRTGTLVLVDCLLFRLFGGQPIDVVDAFHQLRTQRALSIQKEVQFVFAIVSIVNYIGARLPQYQKDKEKMNKVFRDYYRGKENSKE